MVMPLPTNFAQCDPLALATMNLRLRYRSSIILILIHLVSLHTFYDGDASGYKIGTV
jgi:hypothetical protein